MNYEKVSKVIKSDWFLMLLLFLLFSPLYLYKLGQSSLVSFDEAWYAQIARNVLKNGSVLKILVHYVEKLLIQINQFKVYQMIKLN